MGFVIHAKAETKKGVLSARPLGISVDCGGPDYRTVTGAGSGCTTVG